MEGRVSASPAPSPVQAYEEYFVPPLFGPWAEELIRVADPQPGERVLDVGTGTGIVVRHLAPLVGDAGRVDALDLNPAMLALAREIAKREGLAVTFVEGSADALPFDAGSYDLVTCAQSLQYFSDRVQALSEMRRVLVSGGRAICSCWSVIEDQPLMAALAPIVERHIGTPALNNPFVLGSTDELLRLFDAAGFHHVSIETVEKTAMMPDPARWVDMLLPTIMAYDPSMQQLSAEERERLTAALRGDIEAVLREHVDGDLLPDPRRVHVVTGSA